MNTLGNKYDPAEGMVYPAGLRISSLEFSSSLDIMLIQLSNDHILRIPIAPYKRLRDASSSSLHHYELIANGTGIHWPELDEDLSLKGFLQQSLA